jgi:hypothetical protein
MGIHGKSSCEKGARSPIREKDKATDDGILAPKKSKKSTKKVAQDVANDQTSGSEVIDGNESPVDAG